MRRFQLSALTLSITTLSGIYGTSYASVSMNLAATHPTLEAITPILPADQQSNQNTLQNNGLLYVGQDRAIRITLGHLTNNSNNSQPYVTELPKNIFVANNAKRVSNIIANNTLQTSADPSPDLIGTTLLQSPLAFFEVTNGYSPIISTLVMQDGQYQQTLNQGYLIIQGMTHNYVLFVPPGAQLTPVESLQPVGQMGLQLPEGANYFSIATLPDDVTLADKNKLQAVINDIQPYAFTTPVSSQTNLTANQNSAATLYNLNLQSKNNAAGNAALLVKTTDASYNSNALYASTQLTSDKDIFVSEAESEQTHRRAFADAASNDLGKTYINWINVNGKSNITVRLRYDTTFAPGANYPRLYLNQKDGSTEISHVNPTAGDICNHAKYDGEDSFTGIEGDTHPVIFTANHYYPITVAALRCGDNTNQGSYGSATITTPALDLGNVQVSPTLDSNGFPTQAGVLTISGNQAPLPQDAAGNTVDSYTTDDQKKLNGYTLYWKGCIDYNCKQYDEGTAGWTSSSDTDNGTNFLYFDSPRAQIPVKHNGGAQPKQGNRYVFCLYQQTHGIDSHDTGPNVGDRNIIPNFDRDHPNLPALPADVDCVPAFIPDQLPASSSLKITQAWNSAYIQWAPIVNAPIANINDYRLFYTDPIGTPKMYDLGPGTKVGDNLTATFNPPNSVYGNFTNVSIRGYGMDGNMIIGIGDPASGPNFTVSGTAPCVKSTSISDAPQTIQFGRTSDATLNIDVDDPDGISTGYTVTLTDSKNITLKDPTTDKAYCKEAICSIPVVINTDGLLPNKPDQQLSYTLNVTDTQIPKPNRAFEKDGSIHIDVGP